MRLFKQLTSKFSSEWGLICDVIKLFSILHERLLHFNTTDFVMNGGAEEISKRFLQAVRDWMRIEFIESLMINNGLTLRKKCDYDDRNRAIESYINFKPIPNPAVARLNMRVGILILKQLFNFISKINF